MTDAVMKIVQESAKLLNSTLETLAAIRTEMDKLSSALPEYETVMSLYGVGRVMCSQLIAEIATSDALNALNRSSQWRV